MQTFVTKRQNLRSPRQSLVSSKPNAEVNNILRNVVQPKVEVGAANDPAELEADRVADQVMRMPSSHVDTNSYLPSPPLEVQWKCSENCDDNQILGKSDNSSLTGGIPNTQQTQNIENVTGGEPLSPNTKSFFESRFGSQHG